MKEVTYEDWLKNSTPRMMWVWDDDEEEDRKQRKVVYVIKGGPCRYPVRTTRDDDTDYEAYKHCAEIEESKTRRMTNKELSIWIRENPTRELKIGTYVYPNYDYEESEHDLEVTDSLLIREDDSDWREPLVEETTCGEIMAIIK